ncbi:MAG: AAA family ATPase [Desulfobacterales bacterium]
MYLSFYNLSEKPFRIDTDPRFLWFGEKHQEALAVLKYGVLDRNGFVVLTGGIGTGKTTLLNALLESLGDDVLVANINNPKLEILDFLKIVARTYDPAAVVDGKADFILNFTRFLQQAHADGRIVLLVIDEAHRLSQDLLEEIRLLSNAEKAGKRLINIFFIGQNELKQSLLLPECCALRQRVTLFYDIQPLSESEMVQYIGHRLRVAGGQAQLFSADAIHEIHRFSRGYPRLINVICDHALLTGYVQGLKTIPAEVVAECAREIRFPGEAGAVFQKSLIDKLKDRRRAAFRNPHRLPLARRLRRSAADGLKRLGLDVATGRDSAKASAAQETPAAAAPDEGLSAVNEALTAGTEVPPPVGVGIRGPSARVKRQTLFYGGLVAGIGLVAVALTLMVQATTAEKADVDTRVSEAAAVTSLSGPPPVVEKHQPGPESSENRKPSANPPPVDSGPRSLQSAGPPVDEPKPQRLSSLDLAKGALAQQNYRLALELLDAVRNPARLPEFKPLYAWALAGQAGLLLERSPQEAEAMLHKAVALDDKNVAAHLALGKYYTRSKDYARAIDAYQKAVDLEPELSDALFNLGFIYASTAMYENAEKMFGRAVALEPPYLDKALFNLAMVQQKLGKKKQSRASLERVLAIDPGNQKAQTYLKEVRVAEEAGGQ